MELRACETRLLSELATEEGYINDMKDEDRRGSRRLG